MDLYSPAFNQQEEIPSKYTCDGEDISPPLKWENLPTGTESLAVIMDDPDAPIGTWIHWVLFNLPADKNSLSENMPNSSELPTGGKHGINSWGRPGYGGPCPPAGTHRYFFKLYALDTILDIPSGIGKKKLLQLMEGHILDHSELVGLYKRK
jgi:Raf kinase inhibitor-like YbhB/YbcL family protein